MSWRALLLVGVSMLGGCAAREGATVLEHDEIPSYQVVNRPPNLALGPSAEHARLGEWFTLRADWPSTAYGLRLEEISTYSDVTYDDQTFYDRYGGAFFKVQDSVRTGVVVR